MILFMDSLVMCSEALVEALSYLFSQTHIIPPALSYVSVSQRIPSLLVGTYVSQTFSVEVANRNG